MKPVMKVDAREVMQALNALPNAISRPIAVAALKKGAEPIRSAASALAPRDPASKPPHLADNIITAVPTAHQLEQIGDETPVVAVGPRKDFFYGFFNEVGTMHQPARPFMRPAFDANVAESLRIVGAEVWRAIQARAKRLFTAQSNVTSANRATSTGGGLL